MKRNLAKFFNSFQRVADDVNAVIPNVPAVERVESEKGSAQNSLLSAIYAKDSLTGFPTGDIAMYVSKNTSPEVKKYILDNIMIDTSSAANSPAPSGMSDDEISMFSRSDGETREAYTQRMQSIFTQMSDVVKSASVSKSDEDSE